MKFDEASSAWIDKRSSWQFYACEMRMLRTRLSIGILTYFLFSASAALSLDLADIETHREKRTGQIIGLVNRNVAGATRVNTLSRATTDKRAAERFAISSSDSFLSEKGSLLGITDVSSELRAKGATQNRLNNKVVRYDQVYKGLPVLGSEIVAVLSSNDEVQTVSGRFLKGVNLDTTPKVKSKRAEKIALRDMKKRYGFRKALSVAKRQARKSCRTKSNSNKCYKKELRRFNKAQGFYVEGKPTLVIYNEGYLNSQSDGESRLSYKLYIKNDFEQAEEFIVDAQTGGIIFNQDTNHHATTRMITDCSLGVCWSQLSPGMAEYPSQYNPYIFGRREGGPTRGANPVPGATFGSTDVDDTYNMVGAIHAMYEEKFSRNGANNAGGLGDGTCSSCSGIPVNHSRVYVNVNGYAGSWCNPGNARFQFYPNPSGIYFCADSDTYSIFAHEYAHANARYVSFNQDGTYNSVLQSFTHSYGESGALNESNSDIIGVYFQNHIEGGAIDWVLHDDSNISGSTISLSNPPDFFSVDLKPYPDRYNSPNFFCSGGDNGGVHINSTVPSKAAYLASEGGEFNGCMIDGIGIDKVQQIWHEALNNYFTANTTFNQAYFAINQACNSLANPPFTITSVVPPVTITAEDCVQVEKALQAVEMDQAGFCSGIPGTTPTCAAPEYSADFDFSGTVDLNDYQILRGRWSYPNEAARLLSAPPEGDANLDGTVDIEDYNIFVPQFINDNPGVTPPPAPTMVGDLNLDGVMNIDDYIQWLQSQGQTGPGLLADTDVNGVVDNSDLQMWASHYPTGNPADLNNDEVVDLWDYNAIRANWNKAGSGLAADINNDGLVGVFDYEVWFYLYNQIDAPQAPTIPGDYNFDGQVDADDYLAWKAAFGGSGPGIGADGNVDGLINAADYVVWRDNLGATVEPPALLFYPGDCDLDGDVDGADFMSWQRNVGGTSPSALACDFNGDLVVDGADLDLWRANYGNGAG